MRILILKMATTTLMMTILRIWKRTKMSKKIKMNMMTNNMKMKIQNNLIGYKSISNIFERYRLLIKLENIIKIKKNIIEIRIE